MNSATGKCRFGGSAALLLNVSVVLAMSSTAAAAPIVDGRFDPAEGYTLGRWVDLDVPRAQAGADPAQLWTYQDQDTFDVYACFVQPLTLVDNTYGETAIGWGPDAPSGKHHNFEDLIRSDKARFVFTDSLGNVALDATMDYLSQAHKKSGTYRSMGVTGGDGKVDLGLADSVLEWGTSLGYNFNMLRFVLTDDSPATDENYGENADYPGWVFEVIYELRVSGALFGTNGFGDVSVPVVHTSPNKVGKNKVRTKTDEVIAEPATILSLLSGMGYLLWRRNRRPA